MLAACGGDDDDVSSSSTSPSDTATATGDSGDHSPSSAPSSDGGASEGTETVDLSGKSLTLVTYDSFPTSDDDTPINAALDRFSDETGVEVELLQAGDAGTMVSKAALTAGNPEGDVMFGIDNTFLSRAIDDEVFEPYAAEGGAAIPRALRQTVPGDEATPVDFGDVCINYDIEWYDEHDLDPPTSFEDLADEQYADQLVVTNPATSSPGMAFLLATIAEYGDDGWLDYWGALRDNGVEVVDGWEQAYYERFSWAGGGPKPLVVSYGSSPPAEVIYADPPRDDAPTGVVESTCFRQIEYVGVLRGTEEPEAAQALVDFIVGPEFQKTLALNLFVYPANRDVKLPQVFIQYAIVPEDPATIAPQAIGENRARWTDDWTNEVLR